jgi:hypothetical protein
MRQQYWIASRGLALTLAAAGVSKNNHVDCTLRRRGSRDVAAQIQIGRLISASKRTSDSIATLHHARFAFHV